MVQRSNRNPRYANRHRREQLRRKVLREEDSCHLCGQPVDVTLPHGLAGSPELDELLPISRGGDPLSRENVRLAHRRRICNQRRGNKPIFEREPNRTPLTTQRQWATP